MRTLPAARVVAQGRALTSMSQSAGTKVYAHNQANGGQSSLSQLYEVVRAKEPFSGRALAPQQVQEICSVIGTLLSCLLCLHGALVSKLPRMFGRREYLIRRSWGRWHLGTGMMRHQAGSLIAAYLSSLHAACVRILALEMLSILPVCTSDLLVQG